ncbi:hypothetical protein PHYSODRAFT_531783 [Phytophthora sojae]|uniref:Uncharacterized protein n=1 Tax=Phytophthora sojae (strain P6497) TaxID=1094619 RepID=G5ACZ0_PHYSP|nr:hypothetical protein PHYSODRAFT_531783 [Phytophthora sojae]EGZ06044.1 hypothetical protein PHYSODRAFT_531783 [Phytophthora sojae]|eukprot:XP_009537941.1 hypothetical protein PHYSODRAFT_531783 [Phytophthora sojae]
MSFNTSSICRLIHSACNRPSLAAMNSAAVLDCATTDCLVDPQATGAPNR